MGSDKQRYYGVLATEVPPLAIKLAEQKRRVREMKLARLQGLDWRNYAKGLVGEKFVLK